jgi:UDP-N-acetylmuramoyl-L-alanyl-D-glutamate--2,6-diaminopimelate ligase
MMPAMPHILATISRMDILLKKIKKYVPKRLFATLQPLYHYLLALVALAWYRSPSRGLSVVGVTGTNGKTTTATLLYRIATALGYKAGLISTVENVIAGKVVPTSHTTPDPISLNRALRDMRAAGCTHVFMEVSSHALHQNRVMGIRFAGGIFTNITHDHLDYHQSFENYFRAKKKFFEMLPRSSFALSNTDVSHGKEMLAHIDAKTYSYGFTGGEDFHGKILENSRGGLHLTGNGMDIQTKLIGSFNAYNVLAVWSACQLLGFDQEKVREVLREIDPPTGRFEHFVSPEGVMIIVDYAHTPDALENVLRTIRGSFTGTRVIALFGCGGDRERVRNRVRRPAGQRSVVRGIDPQASAAEPVRCAGDHGLRKRCDRTIGRGRNAVGEVHLVLRPSGRRDRDDVGRGHGLRRDDLAGASGEQRERCGEQRVSTTVSLHDDLRAAGLEVRAELRIERGDARGRRRVGGWRGGRADDAGQQIELVRRGRSATRDRRIDDVGVNSWDGHGLVLLGGLGLAARGLDERERAGGEQFLHLLAVGDLGRVVGFDDLAARSDRETGRVDDRE